MKRRGFLARLGLGVVAVPKLAEAAGAPPEPTEPPWDPGIPDVGPLSRALQRVAVFFYEDTGRVPYYFGCAPDVLDALLLELGGSPRDRSGFQAVQICGLRWVRFPTADLIVSDEPPVYRSPYAERYGDPVRTYRRIPTPEGFEIGPWIGPKVP